MKEKKTRNLALCLLLCLSMALGLTGCSTGEAPRSSSAPDEIQHQAMDDVTGLYTHYQSGESMRDRLVGSWSAVTHLDTLKQYNTLVLTAKNTTITSGDRYELSKDLYNGEMGIHIEARFYGEYTFDGNTVTLKVPENYTWVYYRNGRVMGDSYIYQPVDLASTANDGCSFFGDYLDYHGYHRVEEMTVTVDPASGRFVFNIENNDDGAALGAESEDDGFNAGPIFD